MKSGNQFTQIVEELQCKLGVLKQFIGEPESFLESSPDLFLNEMLLLYTDFLAIANLHKKLTQELATQATSIDFERITLEINQLNEKVFSLVNELQVKKKDKISQIHSQFQQQIRNFKTSIHDFAELKKEDGETYKLKTVVHDLKIALLTNEQQKNDDEKDALLKAEASYHAEDSQTVTKQFMRLFNLVNYQKVRLSATAETNAEVITTALEDIRFYTANQLRVDLKNRQNNINRMLQYLDKETALLDSYKKLFSSKQVKVLNEKLRALSTQRNELGVFLKNMPDDPANMDIHFKATFKKIAELQRGSDDYFKQFELFERERRQTSSVSLSLSKAITILDAEVKRNTKLGYLDRVNVLAPLRNSIANKLSNYQSFKGDEYRLTYFTKVTDADKQLKQDIVAQTNEALSLKRVNAVCSAHHGPLSGWVLSLLFKLHSALKSVFTPESYAPTLFATKGGTQMISIANMINKIELTG